jgi:hypothetical protein
MNYTKPNITYLVSKLSKFTSNSNMDNWKVINRILKYFRYILDYGLHYSNYSRVLEEYNDTNWIFDTKDINSLVDRSLHSMDQLYHGNSLSKYVMRTWMWCELRNHMVTQSIIKIEIWSWKAERGLIGMWHNKNLS